MALIDDTFFFGDISLPVDKYSDINEYISRYEPEILRELLGYDLAILVAAYDPGTSDNRIIDLVEGGITFVNEQGKTVLWGGLNNKDSGSLIAYYVYTRYRRDHTTTTTTTGEVMPIVENATVVSSSMKYWRAWENFLRLSKTMYEFIKANIDDYPEFVEADLCKYDGLNAFDL